jgi:MFS family permease
VIWREWLLEHFWWGSVFLINVPLVGIGGLVVAFLVPESRSATATGLDVFGVVLSSLGLLGLTFGFIAAGQHGWGDMSAWITLPAGVVLLVAFVFWQRRAPHPQFFQAIGGATPLGTGLRLLPMIGGLLVGTRLGERVGVTVAKALGQPGAVIQVRSAFTHGMDAMLTSTAILCAAAAVLAAVVLPRGRAKPANPTIVTEEQAPSYVN